MGEFSGSAVGAVEPPHARVLPVSGTRRHRPLTGTAGILLFVCMFMPAMRGCGESAVLPLDVPPFLPPYLYGLVFAFVAMTRSPKGVMAGIVALRLLATGVAFAGFVVFLIAPSVGIVELSVGIVLLATVGSRGFTEHRLALTALIMGAVCTLWFGLWSATADALLGVHLSLASSIGLFLGGGFWFIELLMHPPARMPIAVARRH
jgi:hypothetical protein